MLKGEGERTNGIRTIPCCQTKHCAGVEPPAEIATYRNIRAQTKTDRFLQVAAKFRRIIRVGAGQYCAVSCRIVEIPIAVHFNVFISREQIMAWRYLKNSFE